MRDATAQNVEPPGMKERLEDEKQSKTSLSTKFEVKLTECS